MNREQRSNIWFIIIIVVAALLLFGLPAILLYQADQTLAQVSTETPAVVPTETFTPTPTVTPSLTPTPISIIPTSTPTRTPKPIAPPTPSSTDTPTNTPFPAITMPTATPTQKPTSTLTNMPTTTPTLSSPIPTSTLQPIIPDSQSTEVDPNDPNLRVLRWQWSDTPRANNWFFAVRFVKGNDWEDVIHDVDDKERLTIINAEQEEAFFTYRFNIHNLPEDPRSCNPYWKVAVAMPTESNGICTYSLQEEYNNKKICLLTEFTEPKLLGTAHPALGGSCGDSSGDEEEGERDPKPVPTRP